MALFLTSIWLLGELDTHLANRFSKQYKPLPLPDSPTIHTKDVSLIVPTIEPDDMFTNCLEFWAANSPLEIIIVTIKRDLTRVRELVDKTAPEVHKLIQVFTASVASKREQINVGILASKGAVLALVDDDAIWTQTTVLPYLLAGLEDPEVGACCGMQIADIAPERKHANIITPWEVAAMKACDNCNGGQATLFAGDGSALVLIGRTVVVRGEILRDAAFRDGFANETWMGNRLSTGDDCFTTRWMYESGWKVCIQNAPEAEILTRVYDSSKFVGQNIRWGRSRIQYLITMLFFSPGVFRLARNYPYLTYKLIQLLIATPLSLVHLFKWYQAFQTHPFVATFFLGWYVGKYVTGYNKYLKKHPWIGHKIWAAVLNDWKYSVQDIWCLLTLNQEGWVTKDDRTPAAVETQYEKKKGE